MQVGAARGVDLALLSDTLPHAEAAIISNLTDQASGDRGDDDGS